jgi:hypothetical protein
LDVRNAGREARTVSSGDELIGVAPEHTFAEEALVTKVIGPFFYARVIGYGAMKRTTPLSLVTVTNRNFPSIILFKSGIEELLETLKEEEPTSITIADIEYEYESLDEFFTKYQGKEIKFLRFMAFYSETIMVTIGRSGVSFFAPKTTTKVLGVLLRMEQFFKIHERPANFFFSPVLYTVVIGALLFLVWSMNFLNGGIRVAIGILIMALAALFFYHNRLGGFSRIFSIDRLEQESFWHRNRDEILRQVFSNLLAFMLGILAAYLLFKSGIKF